MLYRDWNPKTFFRQLTMDSLCALQRWAGLSVTPDGEGPLGEQAYRAWKEVAEDCRQRLESDLRLVNDMCATHARPYLEELARSMWTNERAELLAESRDWSVQDLAVRLFVSDSRRFAEVHQSYAVDMMDNRREFQGRYPVHLRPNPEAKARMKEEMATYFRDTACGVRCQVEDFVSDEKFALFIYHEDEVIPVDRFNAEGLVEPVWQRPVVRLAVVFDAETCSLFVKAPRSVERDKLRDLFATIFIGNPDYFEGTGDEPTFCFDPLRDSDFDFPTRGADKIEDVSVVRLVVKTGSRYVKRQTIELVPGLTIDGMRRHLADCGADLDGVLIEGVRLQFQFEGRGRSKYRTVNLHNPNSSNLNDTERDRTIRRYLKEWGIDANGRRAALGASALYARAH